MTDYRITDIELDQKSIVRWSDEVDHERRIAIFDLLEHNLFQPRMALPDNYQGPFRVLLRIEESRLAFDVRDQNGAALKTIILAMTPFRRILKDYFAVCENYYQALKNSGPSQIEAIDMGRRALHNEGSMLLKERLEEKVEVDFDTARRLFTLICVLHTRIAI